MQHILEQFLNRLHYIQAAYPNGVGAEEREDAVFELLMQWSEDWGEGLFTFNDVTLDALLLFLRSGCSVTKEFFFFIHAEADGIDGFFNSAAFATLLGKFLLKMRSTLNEDQKMEEVASLSRHINDILIYKKES